MKYTILILSSLFIIGCGNSEDDNTTTQSSSKKSDPPEAIKSTSNNGDDWNGVTYSDSNYSYTQTKKSIDCKGRWTHSQNYVTTVLNINYSTWTMTDDVGGFSSGTWEKSYGDNITFYEEQYDPYSGYEKNIEVATGYVSENSLRMDVQRDAYGRGGGSLTFYR